MKEGSSLFEWVRSIVIAIILVFVIQTFLFTPRLVDGESMMPTLQDQNRMIVDRISYAFKEPKRFEIIVFKTPEEDYVKRVIGLPGDTVAYQEDVLYINGKPYSEPYLDQYKSQLIEGELLTYNFTMEELTGEQVVPDGQVFVLGDNRRNSIDSREIGMVSMDEIIGKAFIIYWPFKEMRVVSYDGEES